MGSKCAISFWLKKCPSLEITASKVSNEINETFGTTIMRDRDPDILQLNFLITYCIIFLFSHI